MAKEFTITIYDQDRLKRQRVLSEAVCQAAKVHDKHFELETPSQLFRLLDDAVAEALLWEDERVNWVALRDTAWWVELNFQTDEIITGTLKIEDDELAQEWTRAFPDWDKDPYAPYMNDPATEANSSQL